MRHPACPCCAYLCRYAKKGKGGGKGDDGDDFDDGSALVPGSGNYSATTLRRCGRALSHKALCSATQLCTCTWLFAHELLHNLSFHAILWSPTRSLAIVDEEQINYDALAALVTLIVQQQREKGAAACMDGWPEGRKVGWPAFSVVRLVRSSRLFPYRRG